MEDNYNPLHGHLLKNSPLEKEDSGEHGVARTSALAKHIIPAREPTGEAKGTEGIP
jgi:hypothetical protein